MQQPLAYIPSPSRGLIHLGPLPLRGYALMIILGVVVAVWLGERRWAARGGTAGTVVDVAVWAVPFGLVGGRLYHVITDYQLYFGDEWHVARVFEVWKGGLGIWGAIAAGALGAYVGCRRRGVSLRTFADAAAPGIALAQAFGRWGNWFNQELYGRPTKLPWAVEIDPAHRISTPDIGTYHPTFLYESLWCIGVAVLVIWAEKRFRLAYGRTFALYVAAYTVGRAWIEWLRVDSAHHILGLRLNDWTSLIVFLGAVAYLYYYRDRTEIPEGAVGPGATEPGATADKTSDTEDAAGTEEDSATAEDAAGKEAAGKTEDPVAAEESAADAPEPADESAASATEEGSAVAKGSAAKKRSARAKRSTTAKDSATADKSAGEPGESAAEAADASKTSDGEPETPGGAAPESAEPKASKPAASSSAEAGVETETDAASAADAPAESPETPDAAEANGHATESESGESDATAASGEAEGDKDGGKAKASTGAEPGERKS